MKLFRFKNFVRTCAFAIALLLSISSAKAAVDIENGTWTKGWSYCQKGNGNGPTLPDWLPGFGNARNMCYGDGKLYVVDAVTTNIYVIDARTGAKLRQLNMDGVNVGTLKLMDVKYVNGHILACNLVHDKQDQPAGTTRVYYWENDDASTVPDVLLETTDRSSVLRVGDTFAFTGDPTGAGYIWFCGGTKVLRYKVTSGKASTSPEYTNMPTAFGSSPRVVPISDTQFWANDQGTSNPILYTWDSSSTATASSTDQITTISNKRGNDIKPFKLSGSNTTEYAFVSDLSSTGNWYQGNASLYAKGTTGWTKKFSFADLTTEAPGTSYSNAGSGSSLAINLNNKNGETVGMEVWYHFCNEGLAYYHIGDLTPESSTDPDPEPVVDITDQKREMRSAWIATVFNIDWPETKGTDAATVEAQKAQLRAYLDAAKKANLNTVYLQVRSMADAMYKSSYEPWSSYLTGSRGTNPGWDPLEYAVQESHARGLRIEAWVNPYRYSKKNDAPWMQSGWSNALDQVTKSHTISYTNKDGDITILNPAEDWTITRITDVCKEIITNYKVDGLVFDDYFYPNGIPESSAAGDGMHGFHRAADGRVDLAGGFRRHGSREADGLRQCARGQQRADQRAGEDAFAQVLHVCVPPYELSGYTDRSASMGFRRLALRAGAQPNRMPTAAEKPKPSAIAP